VKLYTGRLRDLERVAGKLREYLNEIVFVGYVLRDSVPIFNEITSMNTMPLKISDIQNPGYYELTRGFRFRHSFVSPKWYLLPPEYNLLVVTPNYEVVNSVESPRSRIVLFGIKPCDLRALSALDKLLLNKHPVYTARRLSVVGIVVEECLEPAEVCFCAITDSGPIVGEGFDLAYAKLEEDTVLFKPGSKLGYEIVNALGLEEATRDQVEAYWSVVKRVVNTIMSRVPSLREIVSALERSMNRDDFWKSVSEKCTGCGNCNYVCPTCFCTEIVDRVEESKSTRVALWTGCLTYTYGLVAGGHFRRNLYMRYRHFVLHKFLFYPKQTGGVLGCVGCGRCSTWCPLGLDLKETLSRVAREVK